MKEEPSYWLSFGQLAAVIIYCIILGLFFLWFWSKVFS